MNEIQSIISRLERQRESIDRALGALREIEGTETSAAQKRGESPAKKGLRARRRMSAAGRARIGEATRKRWADKRAAEAAAEKQAGQKRPQRKKRVARKKASAKTVSAAE